MGRIKPDQNVVFYELSSSEPTTRTRLELSEVMVARYNEMLEPIYQQVADIVSDLNCGIVYTGGASQVEGVDVYLKQFFGIKRVHKYAHPVNVSAQPHILLDLQRMNYSTVSGLLMYSQKYFGVSSLKESILPSGTSSFLQEYIIKPWGLFKDRFLKTF
jgi:cell division ATPase FtsA